MTKCLCILILSFVANVIFAQNDAVKLGEATLDCPSTVALGEMFKYVVKLPVKGDGLKITLPEVDGIENVVGPSISTNSNYNVKNGNVTQTYAITYTYVLSATKKKLLKIPSFNIYNENHTAYYVVPGQMVNVEPAKNRTDTTAHRYVGDSIIVKWTASKNKVCVGDTVRCACYMFDREDVMVMQMQGKGVLWPEDCIVDECELPSQKEFADTVLNGEKYRWVKWSEYVVTPTSAGTITMGGDVYEVTTVNNGPVDVDPIDAFFSGVVFTEHIKNLKSRTVTIEVFPNGDDDVVTLDNAGKGTYVLLDISSSMQQLDFNPNRLHCAKKLINGIINVLPDVGLLSYDAEPEYFKAYGEKGKEVVEYIDTLAYTINDGTSISDALVYPLLKTGNVKNMVVVCDGLDNKTHLSFNTAMNILEKSGVSVSMVYVNSGRDSVDYKMTLSNDSTITDDNDTIITLAHDTIVSMPNEVWNKSTISKLSQQLKKTGGELYIVKSENKLASLLPKIVANLQRKKEMAKHPQLSKRLIDGLKKRLLQI